jgi:hypothetical protein
MCLRARHHRKDQDFSGFDGVVVQEMRLQPSETGFRHQLKKASAGRSQYVDSRTRSTTNTRSQRGAGKAD